MAEAKMNKGYLNTNQYKDNPKKPDFVGKVRVDVERQPVASEVTESPGETIDIMSMLD